MQTGLPRRGTPQNWSFSVLMQKAEAFYAIEHALNSVTPASPSPQLDEARTVFSAWKHNLWEHAAGRLQCSTAEADTLLHRPGRIALEQLGNAPEILAWLGDNTPEHDRFFAAIASLSTSLGALERVISRTHGTSTTHTGPRRG